MDFINLFGKSTHYPTWENPQYPEILSSVRNLLDQNSGFIVVTGMSGTGKSTLSQYLTEKLSKPYTVLRADKSTFIENIPKDFMIVDEAQRLNTVKLKEVMRHDFPVLLTGTPVIQQYLDQQYKPIRYNVKYNFILRYLTQTEVKSFILDRLRKMKLPEDTFDRTFQLICQLSGGNIRYISGLCSRALIEHDSKVITMDIIKECGKAMGLLKRKKIEL